MEYMITTHHMTDFVAHLRREERSPATVQKYLHDVRSFHAWLSGDLVTREKVTAWKEALLSQGRSPGTVNGCLAALHNFFSFLGWQDCRVKYLKVQHQVFRDTSRELTRKDFARLVQTARSVGDLRLFLLLETICATGIRVSEVKYITLEAIRQGQAVISLKGKIRTILIPGSLARKLKKYAKKQKIASGEIFLTRSGKGLSRGQIWAAMKDLCKAAGVNSAKVFPHNLRHLFARTFYKASRDIAKLAGILGHSSMETTRIYLITTTAEYTRDLDRLGLVS